MIKTKEQVEDFLRKNGISQFSIKEFKDEYLHMEVRARGKNNMDSGVFLISELTDYKAHLTEFISVLEGEKKPAFIDVPISLFNKKED